jgi:hypothetical protein
VCGDGRADTEERRRAGWSVAWWLKYSVRILENAEKISLILDQDFG